MVNLLHDLHKTIIIHKVLESIENVLIMHLSANVKLLTSLIEIGSLKLLHNIHLLWHYLSLRELIRVFDKIVGLC